MCGITGFSGDLSKDALVLSTKALNHRGPDDMGVFYKEGARRTCLHDKS